MQDPYENVIRAVTDGASQQVCETLGIPASRSQRCEDAYHRGHNGSVDALSSRLNHLIKLEVFSDLKEN
ncbi:MAG: hypothetical protein JW915_09335 [Chitinispirillaceae bacterium]|nr:hypothetical protein [Chitinispirillaceae bacterium]